jgi:hypothetical protein
MWNDPKSTLPLASYEKPERRQQPKTEGADRRLEARRAALGERRGTTAKRVLRSLLRF